MKSVKIREIRVFIKNKSVIVIASPTAVGKTGIAIQLAKFLSTEIISADSRQCYKEMKIGVARPAEAELKKVKHYFIASHSIQDAMNAATFEKYALAITKQHFEKYDVLIMAGGTGLYIKAFCEGMDEIPNVPPEIRRQIILKYEQEGLPWLQKEIQVKDPEFFAAGEIKNPQRLLRALEVSEATGQSILAFRKGEKIHRGFNIIKIGLELPKAELDRNIDSRVDTMIFNGLVSEVKTLLPYKHLSALQTPGYKEIIDHLEGKILLPDAIDLIKKNTRQFAKRQQTWFRKDKEITWFSPKDIDAIKNFLK